MKRIAIVLAIVVIGFSAAQSAAADQRIAGTWTLGSDVWVFNPNGTGTLDGDNNFTYGISANGQIVIVSQRPLASPGRGTHQLFFSPDGRRMIIGTHVFQRN